MSRKLFTEEQIAALRQNPYVYSVSRSTLVLRKSFKEIFYTEYMEGVYPKDIFKNTGPCCAGRKTHWRCSPAYQRGICQIWLFL